MNWLTDFVKPKLNSLVGKKETPSDLWTTCSKCNLMLINRILRKTYMFVATVISICMLILIVGLDNYLMNKNMI